VAGVGEKKKATIASFEGYCREEKGDGNCHYFLL
jgi:hypothetical protein